jgi:small ligand-binding sensory domain FIST
VPRLRIAAALSEHPVAPQAVGETVGQVLDHIGDAPDVVVLFASAAHTGAVEDMAATVRTLLKPGVLVGTTAVSVLEGRREVEESPAFALWAARLPTPARPVRVRSMPAPDGVEVVGIPADAPPGATLLLLTDPFSFPVDQVVDQLAHARPDLRVVGGLASGARGPGGNRLVLDGAVHDDGAVGLLLDPSVPVRTVVSQGCRPIGTPMIVTRSERNVIYELAGRPALDRVMEVIEQLDPDDRALAQQGLHLGRVIDERKADFERGDFLVRNVLGADRSNGAVAVGGEVEVGATVQLQVRDALSADDDLRHLLADVAAPPDGTLVFTCNGRGTHLFGEPHHDAGLVDDAFGGVPTAGMFCAGELGPVGGRTFVHGFTASLVLFGGGDG